MLKLKQPLGKITGQDFKMKYIYICEKYEKVLKITFMVEKRLSKFQNNLVSPRQQCCAAQITKQCCAAHI